MPLSRRKVLLVVVFYLAVAITVTVKTTRYLLKALRWPSAAEFPDVWAPSERARWRTGGFVLFASSKGDSLTINVASGDPTTHIGILARFPGATDDPDASAGSEGSSDAGDDGTLWFMWHADAPDTRRDLTLPAKHSNVYHGGIQLVALDYYLKVRSLVCVCVCMLLLLCILLLTFDRGGRRRRGLLSTARLHGASACPAKMR